jgi:hypothetical protein
MGRRREGGREQRVKEGEGDWYMERRCVRDETIYRVLKSQRERD